jgi:hypothetical protein
MGAKSMTAAVSTPAFSRRLGALQLWRSAFFPRKERLFRIGAALSVLCLTVQCFRDGGFFTKAALGYSRESGEQDSEQASRALTDEMERLLRENDQLTGEEAYELGARNLGWSVDSRDIDAIDRRARLLESEAESASREDWEMRSVLYRVIGEFHLCAARGNPMTIERAADAFVAAGDTVRLYGEAKVAQQRYRRAIDVLGVALSAVPSSRSESVSRMRAKIATLETNIEVLERRIERSSLPEGAQ